MGSRGSYILPERNWVHILRYSRYNFDLNTKNWVSEPDIFDITRWPSPHVGFGSGIHHCLGVNLALMEGQEAFKALAERFTSLQMDPEAPEYAPTIGVRSLVSLPVSWK